MKTETKPSEERTGIPVISEHELLIYALGALDAMKNSEEIRDALELLETTIRMNLAQEGNR